MHPRLKRALLAAALFSAIAWAGAACDDDAEDDDDDDVSQAAVATLTARVQRDSMLHGVLAIDGLDLHGMAEAIADGQLETTHAPMTRELVRVLALTDWGDLQGDADTLRGHASDLLAAIEDNDLATAQEHAPELHEVAHQFTTDAWAKLTEAMPELPAGDDHGATPGAGDDHGAATPAGGHDDMMPTAAATP